MFSARSCRGSWGCPRGLVLFGQRLLDAIE
jgi:hypothetical protein